MSKREKNRIYDGEKESKWNIWGGKRENGRIYSSEKERKIEYTCETKKEKSNIWGRKRKIKYGKYGRGKKYLIWVKKERKIEYTGEEACERVSI